MILKTKLLQHQQTAVEKLMSSRVGGLFMEMGTGKSRTIIELAARRLEKISNIVWFCPVSLKQTVRHEIQKHTDAQDNDICVFDDKTNQKNLPQALWYVIGIESMSSSTRIILTTVQLINKQSFVIVDESSYIKNHCSNRTRFITQISAEARYRYILTGTPLANGIVDIFAQMNFLSPKILGYRSFYSFAANHLEYSEKYPDLVVRALNTEYLAAKINPYVYQVKKSECLDLPKKTYTTYYFNMTMYQMYMYGRAKDDILLSIDVDAWDSYTIFQLFSALQQIVCGFSNKYNDTFEDKRIDTMMEAIGRIPSDEKIIIWCKYRYDIERITTELNEPCSVFYGDKSEKERHQEIENWRKKNRILVATPASGGHGLTLNEAAYVIFYNNSFKYAERLQAEDRCHRIGQERNVLYIDIVCSNSIDERIMEAIWNKESIANSFKREVDAVKDNEKKIKDWIKKL